MQAKIGAAMLVATALGGCAATMNAIGDPVMAPGKFQFLGCDDIAKRWTAAQSREQELRVLMDRADRGVGGSTVNVLVYGPDLQTVQSELRQLRVTAGEKRCSEEALKAAPKADIPPRR
jgi:hypothetical protein